MNILTAGIVAAAVAVGGLIAYLGMSLGVYRAKVVQLEASLADATAAGAEWQTATWRVQASLAQCQAQWADEAGKGAAAMVAVEEAKTAAQKAQQAWQARWDARTLGCTASLAAMQVACESEIGDY